MDQRGYPRFYDGNMDGVSACDVGAFEYGASAVPPAPADETDSPEMYLARSPEAPSGSLGWDVGPVTLNYATFSEDTIEIRCALDLVPAPLIYADLPEDSCQNWDSVTVSQDGYHTFYLAGMDSNNNQSEITSLRFQIDTTAPMVTCPAVGPFLLQSGDQPVGPAGVDAAVSGLDEAGSTLSGIVTTESIGAKTLTFTAFDLAGNRSDTICPFSVIYDFGGFYPPVAPIPVLNPVSAISAVPLKFSLARNQGLEILAAGYPTVQPMNCQTKEPLGLASPTKPAGKSGLSYDPLTGWYNYMWKTEKAKAGTCQLLSIQLIDGTQHLVYFRFQ